MKRKLLLKQLFFSGLLALCSSGSLYAAGEKSAVAETMNVMQQQRSVKCVVSDSHGPIIGANVIIKGTATGAITDLDGIAVIENVEPNATLIISYIGYITQEVSINNQATIEIRLQDDTQSLEEVVVVGYGTQQKKDITGSVAVVNTKELMKTPAASVSQQLQGRAAGVVIGSSGSPGASSMVRIRGIGTLNDNGPLYVIDGVSSRNQNLSDLSPNDIESVQVLKDASAAAIYGAQASNGVILITTKKGTTNNQPKLFYDGYFGASMTGKKYEMLNSTDRLNLEWDAQKSASKIRGNDKMPNHAQFGTGDKPQIPNYLSAKGANGQNLDPNNYSYPDNMMVAWDPIGTDWWDAIDRVGTIQNHQLSAQGGNDKGQYTFSANYFNQEGTVIHQYFTRYQLRANTSFNIRPWLRVGENLRYTFTKDNGLNEQYDEATPYSWTFRASPWVPVHDIGGHYAGSKIAGTGNFANIYAQCERNKDNYWSRTRVFGNAWAEVDLMKNLTFRTNYGIDYFNAYSYSMSKKNLEHSESPGVNGLSEASRFNFRWVWTNTLTYNTTFNDVHKINVLLGTEAIRDGLGRSMSAYRRNYLFEDDINTWTLDMGENNEFRTNGSNYNGEFALFGIFGRVDYAFSDKYLVTGILRRDGVSRFSQKNRYGIFPSISLGWRLSEEAFMESTRSWLDDLKLRIGYGQTGNAEVPRATNFTNTYSTNPSRTNYDFTGKNLATDLGYRLGAFGNDDTKWERTEMTNIGLDATFGGGKFSTSIEWYNKLTTDMLVTAAYSSMAGEASPPYINIGNMKNSGFDFSVDYRDQKGDLSWNVGLNLSAYKNIVLKLGEADDAAFYGYTDRVSGPVSRTIKGSPIAEFYGYNITGFYESEAEATALVPLGESKGNYNPSTYIGKYKIEDINGDGRITTDDRKPLGSPHPLFVSGLNLGLNYKNVDFSMFWYASYGNKIFNSAKYFQDFWLFNGGRSARMRDNSWEPGKANATLPILDRDDTKSGTNANSYYVEDGSYLRMKNLMIGYTFPKTMLKKATISNLRVYAQVENLFTITSYQGLDPEVTMKRPRQASGSGGELEKGIDGGGVPNTIKFLFGVNFAF